MAPSTAIKLAFYLKHFNDATIHTVLSATGYKCISEYETLCRQNDLFPVSIDTRGLMTSVCPNVDTTKYRVFEFSIHHLTYIVQETLMREYIGMNLTAYELEYPAHNNIYVVVPYHDYYSQCCVDTDSEFAGWTYRLNRNTKNSYIIKPPATYGKVRKVSADVVTFNSGKYMPTIIETDFSGFSSPLYYSKTYKGWIASLSLKQELVSAGVVKRTRRFMSASSSVKSVKQEKYVDDEYEVILVSSDDEEVAENLSKWQFHVNPVTQNSYVLYTTDSKLSKSTPRTWKMEITGLDRPLYYNANVDGWVIGLRFKQALIDAGASYVSRSPNTVVKVEAKVGVAPSAVNLSGWQFWLNTTTQNSYVLSTNDSKLFKATPKTWTLDFAGLDRPVYYSATENGWLVGLRFKDALFMSGAYEVYLVSSDNEVEVATKVKVEKATTTATTLGGWQFRLNPTTKNSYVLSTTDSKLFKSTPRTWTLELADLDRPVYYNASVNGWLVGLRFKDALLAAGATQQ